MTGKEDRHRTEKIKLTHEPYLYLCNLYLCSFDPERSWPDNTNLDKARRLLDPVKAKYGNGLSWGDLFALSGTVAIKAMGGPVIGFCAGRVDVQDNSQTLPLGPSPEQEKFAKCEVNGACPFPLGQNTLGLVYVNPEGPMGQPDPQGAADTIRDVFGRMDWNGRELVALIGGGHTFGKAHGASKASNGEVPEKCPFASWNGPTGVDAITSGFEGPWYVFVACQLLSLLLAARVLTAFSCNRTSEPTKWDNKYFQYLIDYEWEAHQGPGGHWQWRVVGRRGPTAPVADKSSNSTQDVMMLTTDVALFVDPEYNVYVREFAENKTAFAEAFANAWYKLVTRDMGPIERCVGSHVPPAQRFQHLLPDPPTRLADMHAVAKDLDRLMDKNDNDAEFLRLAFQCASTFRATDYQGGCNGARIRFRPGIEWEINAGLNDTLEELQPIKKNFGKGLTWADLIVLSGNVAAERAGSPELSFCPGRADALDGSAWKRLEYKIDKPPSTVDDMIENYQRRGQSAQEFVALTFPIFKSSKGLRHALASRASDGDVMMKGLQFYPELRQWADYYSASGDKEYGNDFSKAWTKLMNADRFDGPVRRVCSD